MDLSSPITSLPQTRSLTFKRFQSIGINTYADLLHYFPFRYENYSVPTPIAHLIAGNIVGIQGTVEGTRQVLTRSGLKMQYIRVRDVSGSIETLWFNQPYILSVLKIGQPVSIVGELDIKKKPLIVGRDFELVKGELIHTGRIVPVYSEIYGLSSRTIREKVWRVIQLLGEHIIPDELPDIVLRNETFVSLDIALHQIHFPSSQVELDQAKMRLGFDELFYIQLSSQIIKNKWHKQQVNISFEHTIKQDVHVSQFIKSLPFELTPDQIQVLEEIRLDFTKAHPMNRFLQGDVGSGKTVIAAIAAYIAFLNNAKTLIMAPTEILAKQHFDTLTVIFQNHGIKVGLQTGAYKHVTKKGEEAFDILVGTQALLSSHMSYEKVGLIVIDEQHRFGVADRALLKSKTSNPHLLTMTATPIPRTVALTLYGELDVSVIESMPKGRMITKTFIVSPLKRKDAYEWIRRRIHDEHEQLFVVCPLVDESEHETMKSVKAVTVEFENLKTQFPEFSIGLLHGKIKAVDKNIVMDEFKNNTHHILLSTSVVEVGIDIPNATIMLIEGAERFGMAQLHQLRGRVGRGKVQSYCLLFTSNPAIPTDRLTFFATHSNGAKLAEFDLKTRGPGSIFGTNQHGFTELKIADITDASLISQAQKAAKTLLSKDDNLKNYPKIKAHLESIHPENISRD